MSRRFKPKQADTLADFVREAAALVVIVASLLYLHTL